MTYTLLKVPTDLPYNARYIGAKNDFVMENPAIIELMFSQLDNQTAVRIALAAIIQAVIDASQDDPQAESWLLSTGFDWLLCSGIYIDPCRIRAAILTRFNRAELNRFLIAFGAQNE